METRACTATVAVARVIWAASPPTGGVVSVLDDDLAGTGFTRRAVEKALVRLERSGALVWERKRPGPPPSPVTVVVVDVRCPAWVELGVAS